MDVYTGMCDVKFSGFIRNICRSLYVFQVCVSTIHSLLDRVSGTESEGALWDSGIHWGQLWFWLVHSSDTLGLEEQSTKCEREWGVATRRVVWSNASVQLTVVIMPALLYLFLCDTVWLLPSSCLVWFAWCSSTNLNHHNHNHNNNHHHIYNYLTYSLVLLFPKNLGFPYDRCTFPVICLLPPSLFFQFLWSFSPSSSPLNLDLLTYFQKFV